MMADLHTVPCSSAVLYGQGASLHGCWALQQWETLGIVAVQENHIKDILSSLPEHVVLINWDNLKVIKVWMA